MWGTLPGGTPVRTSEEVPDMPQLVCLLRSCRRTFLFIICLLPEQCVYLVNFLVDAMFVS